MTPAEFKLDFPQFASESDERIQREIDNAAPFFDVERWAAFYTAGLGNYVAHKIALGNYLTAQTPASTLSIDVTVKKVGDVTVQRDPAIMSMAARDPFMRTIYGQEYLRLRRMIGGGGLAV